MRIEKGKHLKSIDSSTHGIVDNLYNELVNALPVIYGFSVIFPSKGHYLFVKLDDPGAEDGHALRIPAKIPEHRLQPIDFFKSTL